MEELIWGQSYGGTNIETIICMKLNEGNDMEVFIFRKLYGRN